MRICLRSLSAVPCPAASELYVVPAGSRGRAGRRRSPRGPPQRPGYQRAQPRAARRGSVQVAGCIWLASPRLGQRPLISTAASALPPADSLLDEDGFCAGCRLCRVWESRHALAALASSLCAPGLRSPATREVLAVWHIKWWPETAASAATLEESVSLGEPAQKGW